VNEFMSDDPYEIPELSEFPPGLGRPEISPGAERQYWMSLLRRLLHPFRRKAT
jgi:hypothetical protein